MPFKIYRTPEWLDLPREMRHSKVAALSAVAASTPAETEASDLGTGADGESFNIYDASSRVWRQIWVTNRGVFLPLAEMRPESKWFS